MINIGPLLQSINHLRTMAYEESQELLISGSKVRVLSSPTRLFNELSREKPGNSCPAAPRCDARIEFRCDRLGDFAPDRPACDGHWVCHSQSVTKAARLPQTSLPLYTAQSIAGPSWAQLRSRKLAAEQSSGRPLTHPFRGRHDEVGGYPGARNPEAKPFKLVHSAKK